MGRDYIDIGKCKIKRLGEKISIGNYLSMVIIFKNNRNYT